MKRSRFIEEKIAWVLRGRRRGRDRECVPQTRKLGGPRFTNGRRSWVTLSVKRQADKGARGTPSRKKLLAQAMPGCRRFEGHRLRKVMTPAAKRQAVA